MPEGQTTKTKKSWSLASRPPKETQPCSDTRKPLDSHPESQKFSAFTKPEFQAFVGSCDPGVPESCGPYLPIRTKIPRLSSR